MFRTLAAVVALVVGSSYATVSLSAAAARSLGGVSSSGRLWHLAGVERGATGDYTADEGPAARLYLEHLVNDKQFSGALLARRGQALLDSEYGRAHLSRVSTVATGWPMIPVQITRCRSTNRADSSGRRSAGSGRRCS